LRSPNGGAVGKGGILGGQAPPPSGGTITSAVPARLIDPSGAQQPRHERKGLLSHKAAWQEAGATDTGFVTSTAASTPAPSAGGGPVASPLTRWPLCRDNLATGLAQVHAAAEETRATARHAPQPTPTSARGGAAAAVGAGGATRWPTAGEGTPEATPCRQPLSVATEQDRATRGALAASALSPACSGNPASTALALTPREGFSARAARMVSQVAKPPTTGAQSAHGAATADRPQNAGAPSRGDQTREGGRAPSSSPEPVSTPELQSELEGMLPQILGRVRETTEALEARLETRLSAALQAHLEMVESEGALRDAEQAEVAALRGEVTQLHSLGDSLAQGLRDLQVGERSAVERAETAALRGEITQLRGLGDSLAEELRLERDTRGAALQSLRTDIASLREDLAKDVSTRQEPSSEMQDLHADVCALQGELRREVCTLKEPLAALQDLKMDVAALQGELRKEVCALREPSSEMRDLDAGVAALREELRMEVRTLQEDQSARGAVSAELEEMVRELRSSEGRLEQQIRSGVEAGQAQLALVREELLVKMQEAEEGLEQQLQGHTQRGSAALDNSSELLGGITQALEAERVARGEGFEDVRNALRQATEALHLRVDVLSAWEASAAAAAQAAAEEALRAELLQLREELQVVDCRHGEEFQKCSDLCEGIAGRSNDLVAKLLGLQARLHAAEEGLQAAARASLAGDIVGERLRSIEVCLEERLEEMRSREEKTPQDMAEFLDLVQRMRTAEEHLEELSTEAARMAAAAPMDGSDAGEPLLSEVLLRVLTAEAVLQELGKAQTHSADEVWLILERLLAAEERLGEVAASAGAGLEAEARQRVAAEEGRLEEQARGQSAQDEVQLVFERVLAAEDRLEELAARPLAPPPNNEAAEDALRRVLAVEGRVEELASGKLAVEGLVEELASANLAVEGRLEELTGSKAANDEVQLLLQRLLDAEGRLDELARPPPGASAADVRVRFWATEELVEELARRHEPADASPLPEVLERVSAMLEEPLARLAAAEACLEDLAEAQSAAAAAPAAVQLTQVLEIVKTALLEPSRRLGLAEQRLEGLGRVEGTVEALSEAVAQIDHRLLKQHDMVVCTVEAHIADFARGRAASRGEEAGSTAALSVEATRKALAAQFVQAVDEAEARLLERFQIEVASPRQSRPAEPEIREAMLRLEAAEEQIRNATQTLHTELFEEVRVALEEAKEKLEQQQAGIAKEAHAFAAELTQAVGEVESKLVEQIEAAAAKASPRKSGLDSEEAMWAVSKQVEDLEGRLVKRHENLVLTVNKDIGRLELRLDRQHGDDSASASPAAAAAAAAGDGAALDELRAALKEQGQVQSANLQELGELVLGEIAALRVRAEETWIGLDEHSAKASGVKS